MRPSLLEELEIVFNSYSAKLDEYRQKNIFTAISDASVPHQFKTKAIFFLRKHKKDINLELFSQVTGMEKSMLKELLNNEIIKAYFPIAAKDTSQLSALYTIKTNNKGKLSFKENINTALSVIENLLQSSFFVMFEDDFIGNSFMLALIATLITNNQNRLERFSFSGAVDIEGNILDVEMLTEKERISKLHNKRFIYSSIANNLIELSYFLNNTKIDLPFCIAIKSSSAQNMAKDAAFRNLQMLKDVIEEKIDVKIESIKKLYGLNDEDFVFYTDKNFIDKNGWKQHIIKAYEKIKILKSKIDDKIAVLHFTFLTSSTFSFCIGALLGCKDPFVAYHYSAGRYHAVLNYKDKDPRNLKEIPENTKHIKCSFNNKTSSVLVMILYLASHNPIGDIKQYLGENYDKYSTLICSLSSGQGKIPLGDWSAYIQEMYKYYNDTKNYKISKRMLFFSTPVILAFGLGLDIEIFDDMDIYNLENEKEKYVKVANLKELRM